MPELTRKDVHNFAAGPSPLPAPVLEKAAQGLMNYNGTGMGVCELSHRGKEFMDVIKGAEQNLRKILAVPDSHAILFTQGGGTQQFSSVFLNLINCHRQRTAAAGSTTADEVPTVDYVVTGSWSSKAAKEAQRLSIPTDPKTQEPLAKVNIAASTKDTKFTILPRKSDYKFSPSPAYVYYCENETIEGVQFPDDESSEFSFPFDSVPKDTLIAADYSSSFVSRPIRNIERHAVIYAGAQKNLGPSGLTIVIVRKDLLVDTTEVASALGRVPLVPITLEYKTLADNASLYNTPPTFAIYVSALVLEYLFEEKGGIRGLEAMNKRKAQTLYQSLEKAQEQNAVKIKVTEPDARSWMNVTFELVGGGKEAEFLKQAEAKGFRQIKGHRSIGGIRLSLYNAVEEASVQAFCKFLEEFVASP